MRRPLRLIVAPVAIAAFVISLGVACDDEGAQGCRVDLDCPAGNICRGSICGLANPEAGVADSGFVTFDAPSTTCSNDGVICTQATECCGQNCVDGRCASSPTSLPTCKGLYQICQNDCCSGYTCKNGSCQ